MTSTSAAPEATPAATGPTAQDAQRSNGSTEPTRGGTLELTDQTNLLPPRKVVVIMLGLTTISLVTTLDSVIVATALPTVSAFFHAGAIASWVPSAYLLTSTAFQPLYGRFSDIFGRKLSLAVAMGMYMAGCLAAGFSRTIVELIVFRAIAGAGGGGLTSLLQIVLSDILSLRDRGKYVGIVGAWSAVGYAVGPLIGGALAEKVTWRWCFWITLPLAALSQVVIQIALPLKPVGGDMKKKLLAVDYVGSILTVGGCTMLILPLIWGGVTFPWSSAIVLGPLIAGVVVTVLFCLWEWKGARMPIVPMYIFKHATVTGVYITMFINGYCFFTALYYLPQFFQVALGYSPIRSGTFLLPLVVSQIVASIFSGWIVSKTGRYRALVNIGFSLLAIGSGCISSITQRTPKGLIIFYMLMAGLGAGQTTQTTTVAAQASVSRRDMSVVTAVRNFLRMLGGALALAVGSTVLNNTLRNALSTLSLPSGTIEQIINDPSTITTALTPSDAAYAVSHGYNRGFRAMFSINAGLSVGALAASVLLIRHKELTRGDEDRLRKEARGEKAAGEDVEMGKKNNREAMEGGHS